MTVNLHRFDWRKDCTLGTLILPGGVKLATLELPWLDNRKRVSCIPVGTYQVHRRFKGMFRNRAEMQAFAQALGKDEIPGFKPGHTLIYNYVTGEYVWVVSSQNFGDHFHLQNVPDRSGILFHHGNYTFQIQGCILPGKNHVDLNKDGIPDVTNSRWAMDVLRSQFNKSFTLIIH